MMTVIFGLVACMTLASAAMSELSVIDSISGASGSLQRSFLNELAKTTIQNKADGNKKAVLASDEYSTTGFVYANYFSGIPGLLPSDPTCQVQTTATFYAVNLCYVTSSYAMKFQLTQGTTTALLLVHVSYFVYPFLGNRFLHQRCCAVLRRQELHAIPGYQQPGGLRHLFSSSG
jgi:hypothetical protein